MKRSTVVLGAVCLMLGGALVGTAMALWPALSAPEIPVGETYFEIGLNDVRPNGNSDIVESDSALLWDSEAGVIKYEANGFERRPIASLTKLMTAMVALDYGVDLDKEMTILPEEYRIGGRLVLAPGESVTMRDLLHASLMGSANNATLAFVRGVGVDEAEFLRAMNRKAIEIGLEQTEFVELTGLDFHNISTAYEVAKIAETAWRDYPIIAEITSKIKYQYIVRGSGREHTIVNTNNLMVDYDYKLAGSKTGYLYEAGFCLVVRKADDNNLIAVVLGSPSEWDSMSDARTLLERP
jgi:D-alanyl-D-alanine endopeptidase (penicillin-binding protein 7)